MAMTKCRECGNQLSTKAQACPQCGAIYKSGSPILTTIKWIILAPVIAVVGYCSWMMGTAMDSVERGKTTQAATSSAPAKPAAPQLHIVSWKCTRERNWMKTEGEVRNISANAMDGVMAVATYRTKSGEFVTSDDALIEYQPILPNQTSPFSVMTRNNPEISGCEVAFKKIMGGAIPTSK